MVFSLLETPTFFKTLGPCDAAMIGDDRKKETFLFSAFASPIISEDRG